MRSVVPAAELSMQMSPSSASTPSRSALCAGPRPDRVGDRAGGGNAVGKERALQLLGRVTGQPGATRALLDGRPVDAAPVVGDLDDDALARDPGAQRQGAVRRIAGGHPVGGRLDAVIDGVANGVHAAAPKMRPPPCVEADAMVLDHHRELLF